VGGDARLGHAMHVAGADLHFDQLAIGREHRRVERLVHVALRGRDVVLEALVDRRVESVQDPERVVAVANGGHDHPQGQQVVIPLWLAIMALFRDFSIVIVAVILYAVEGVHRFPPSVLGKATTFMHVVTVCVVLLANLVPVPELATTACFYTSFTLVILSGFNYIYRASRFIEAARQERNGSG
jgi:hypothetical protein